MQDRLTTEELIRHWLLNLAIEVPISLYLLFPNVEGEALNVRPIPGCSAAEYARGLTELFDSGMIRMSSELPEDDVEGRPGVSRILDRFLDLPKDIRQVRFLRPDDGPLEGYGPNRPLSLQVSFQLTALGGETWQGIAEPDWTHILTESRTSKSGEVISPDRDLMMAHMGWYPQINNERIQLETVAWQTHSDFEILYWKRLPFVHRASFALQPADERWWSTAWPKWFDEWFSCARHWYKQPWELPGWPSE